MGGANLGSFRVSFIVSLNSSALDHTATVPPPEHLTSRLISNRIGGAEIAGGRNRSSHDGRSERFRRRPRPKRHRAFVSELGLAPAGRNIEELVRWDGPIEDIGGIERIVVGQIRVGEISAQTVDDVVRNDLEKK